MILKDMTMPFANGLTTYGIVSFQRKFIPEISIKEIDIENE